MTDVAIVIVNWNGRKYLKDCFDSLQGQICKDFKIIFVDNGSEDDSVDFVEKNYPETKIIKLKKNTGFCFGYNAGIRKALKDENIKYIIVLNNDTKLDERYIEELTSCAKRYRKAGSIQPKILNFYEKNKIDCAGIYITRDGTAHNRGYGKSVQIHNEEKEIFGANGTASLFTREALEKTRFAGGEYFDNAHFAFYEDVDLAWRIRQIGLKSYYCPRAVVYHVHSGTAGNASLTKVYYLHRNYFFTVIKNYSCGKLIKTLSWRFLSYVQLVANIFKKKKRETEFVKGQNKGRVALVILKAWGSVIVNIPNLLKKRRIIQKTKNRIIPIVLLLLASFVFSSFVRAETLKIGFVTDWEYGKYKEFTHKLPSRAKKYLKRAVAHYNKKFKPDLVIGGGDYILGSGISKARAKKQLVDINKIFKRLSAPRRYCIGNHDLGKLSEEEVQASLGINYNHSVTDIRSIRVITLDTNELAPGEDEYKTSGRVSDKELAWLDEQLNTNLPVIVFSHHSPIQTPEAGSWRTNILKANDLRAVLEKYGNVVAIFSGHHAVNYSEERNGINYFIINNLTDSRARGSFADISVEMKENGEVEIYVVQYGKNPANYQVTKQITGD